MSICLRSAVKLADRDGNYIGILFVPERVAEMLDVKGEVEVHLPSLVSVSSFSGYDNIAPIVVHRCYFVRSHGRHPDTVNLYGKEPEEMTTFPGYCFVPAYGYPVKALHAPAT